MVSNDMLLTSSIQVVLRVGGKAARGPFLRLPDGQVLHKTIRMGGGQIRAAPRAHVLLVIHGLERGRRAEESNLNNPQLAVLPALIDR